MGYTAANLRLAIQAAQGTPQTADFFCGRLTSLSLGAVPEYSTDDPTYSCDAAGLPIAKTAPDDVLSYLVQGTAESYLFSGFPPLLLAGAGFATVTTADSPETGAHTHVQTVAADSAYKWLTAYKEEGDVSTDGQRIRATDMRVNQFQIQDQARQLRYTAQMRALKEDDPGSTPAATTEPTTKILANKRTFTITQSATAIGITKYGSNTFTVDTPLKEDDYGSGTLENAGLATDGGIGVSGQIGEIELEKDLYKKIVWGGTSGTGPSATIAQATLQFKWTSGVNIGATATPYSCQIDIPTAQLKLSATPVNSGLEVVTFGIDYEMIGDTSTPITITWVNGIDDYGAV